MFTLWIAAALLAAGAAALIAQRARAAGDAGHDPAKAVYRRQLAEIDELAARGLMGEAERRVARAETGRRLLAAADAPKPLAAPPAVNPHTLMLLAAAPALAAVGLYLAIGAPLAPDQPFAARLAAWRAHPERAAPAELAATLRAMARLRPSDPEPLKRLAVLSFSLGDLPAAAEALRRADRLTPGRSEILEPLGEILVLQAGGEETAEAAALFRRVLALDPRSPAARYHLARGRVAAGDAAGGLAQWKTLLADLPSDDPRRAALVADIAAVTAAGRLPASQSAPAPGVASAIRGMVEGLATRLKAQPDDPQGWVRLVRAYTVLGETAKRDAALGEARRRYAGEPAVLLALDDALKTRTGAP